MLLRLRQQAPGIVIDLVASDALSALRTARRIRLVFDLLAEALLSPPAAPPAPPAPARRASGR